MKPTKPHKPPLLFHLRRTSGGTDCLVVPAGSRVSIFKGDPVGGQLRIYQGTRLIGFFPDVAEFYEVGSISTQPLTLPPANVKFIPNDYEPNILKRLTEVNEARAMWPLKTDTSSK